MSAVLQHHRNQRLVSMRYGNSTDLLSNWLLVMVVSDSNLNSFVYFLSEMLNTLISKNDEPLIVQILSV